MCHVSLCACLELNLAVIFSICTKLGCAEPSLLDLLDLPPNMTNFILLGLAEPSTLLQANLHAAWLVTVLPSSQQCSNVPVNSVVSAQHCAMAFLLVCRRNV